jgi:hypothetical protein
LMSTDVPQKAFHECGLAPLIGGVLNSDEDFDSVWEQDGYFGAGEGSPIACALGLLGIAWRSSASAAEAVSGAMELLAADRSPRRRPCGHRRLRHCFSCRRLRIDLGLHRDVLPRHCLLPRQRQPAGEPTADVFRQPAI